MNSLLRKLAGRLFQASSSTHIGVYLIIFHSCINTTCAPFFSPLQPYNIISEFLMFRGRMFVAAVDVLSPWQWWLGRARDREVLDDWRDRSDTELCSKYGQTSYMATIYQSLPTAHERTIFPSHPQPVWVQLRWLLFCDFVWFMAWDSIAIWMLKC